MLQTSDHPREARETRLDRASPDQLRRLMIQKWPEAVAATAGLSEPIFHTGIEGLDALFPRRGIPYGQLIELTGADGSGKTSLLFMLLATLTKTEAVIYIDLSGSFFPAAAASCGVDITRLVVVRPDSLPCALRTAELLLSQQVASNIVIDLTSGSGGVSKRNSSTKRRDLSPSPLSPPPVLLHRLRQQAARSKALIIFLTENNDDTNLDRIIPASTVALRLEVTRSIGSKDSPPATATQRVGPGLVSGRCDGATQGRTLRENNNAPSMITVTVTKSRISKEGARAEVALHE